jgi:hypothetical protein
LRLPETAQDGWGLPPNRDSLRSQGKGWPSQGRTCRQTVAWRAQTGEDQVAVQSEWDPGTIEVGQDLPFQERMWLAQRIGWIAMLAIVVAAATGLFGHGPLAEGRAASGDGTLRLSFEQIARHGVPTAVTIGADRALQQDGKLTVWVARAWLRGVELESVVPDPAETHEAPSEVGFEFNVTDGVGASSSTSSSFPEARGARWTASSEQRPCTWSCS